MQKFQCFGDVDVTDADSSEAAYVQADGSALGPISYVFTCAGSSKPGFFIEQPVRDFEDGIKLNYLGTLYTLKAITNTLSAGMSTLLSIRLQPKE